MDFDNRTDSELCYYLSGGGEIRGDCNQEIKPNRVTGWSPECGLDQHLTFILTVGASGQRIYEGIETCRDWNDTNRRFVIEQVGEEFIVTSPQKD